jgi:phosphatidylserine/phosphatidylglycerophosphate/cardiolipin synthase-like enzyme
MWLKFIKSAKTSLQIQNQYITDEDLASVIIAAKKNNPHLKIEINLSDLCEYGSISDKKRYAARLMFQAFEDSGVALKMFPKGQKVNGRSGYLHAKAIVVDGKRAWIGSVNGSSTSLNQNREFGIYFSQSTRVRELSRQLEDDFGNPQSISWKKSVLDCPVKKSKREFDEI